MKIVLPDLIVAGGLALAASIPLTKCSLAYGAEVPDDQAVENLTQRVLKYTPTWYPPGGGPETTEERESRWGGIVSVAWHESQEAHNPLWPNDQAALVLATWKFESAFDYHVHGGEVSPLGTQDNGKARCLGQLHQNARTEKEWRELAGRTREATERCARATLGAFWYHAERCKLRRDIPKAKRWRGMLSLDEVAILMGAYGTGTTCKALDWQKKRVEEFEKLRSVTL